MTDTYIYRVTRRSTRGTILVSKKRLVAMIRSWKDGSGREITKVEKALVGEFEDVSDQGWIN